MILKSTEKVCGVYAIKTPNGDMYVGGTTNMYQRWKEHRSELRHKRHHAKKLQEAYDKYGDQLDFLVLELCCTADLKAVEQKHITEGNANLNTSKFVDNNWLNEGYKERMKEFYDRPEVKKFRQELGKRTTQYKMRSVDCSDGSCFDSMADAARQFGVTVSAIKHLCTTQRVGRVTGVRFKFSSEEWRDVVPWQEQAQETKKRLGKILHTEETKQKLKAAWVRRRARMAAEKAA